jgi:cytochrome c556
MYRLFTLGALALAVAFSTALAEDKKEETPDIDTIMEKAHGKGGLRAQILAAAKGDKWDDAKKASDEWTKLAVALGKNKPPQGEADSWKKETETYSKVVKTLADAVKDKKAADVTKANKALNASCVSCHKAHKP